MADPVVFLIGLVLSAIAGVLIGWLIIHSPLWARYVEHVERKNGGNW